jgi:uncharacterized membrane protein
MYLESQFGGNMSYTQRYGQSYRPNYEDDDNTNWSYVVTGALFVAAGAYLIFRGVNQEDSDGGFYAPAPQSRSRGQGIEVRESIVVDKPAAELYSFWRKLENLPRIMSHLESVTEMGRRSHWKAKAPLGMSVEWDATTTEDRPNELIAWRSDPNSQVPNEGSVRFSGIGAKSVHNPYTIVSVSLTYHPPLGPVGAAVAKLFGQEPSQQIKDDLQNFKQAVESGSLSLA